MYLNIGYVFESNILTITDCILFDDCTGTIITDKYNITSGATISYSTYNNSKCIYRESGGFILPSIVFSKDNKVVIEFDAVANNMWAWLYLLASPSNTDITTNLKMSILSSSYDRRGGKINITYFPYNTDFASVKLVKDGTTLTVYVNDVLKGTATDVDLTDYPYFCITGSYNHFIKNIRIKPYSE